VVDLRRLRWRLAGATMWPAFGVFVVVGAAVLHWLPPYGEHGVAVIPSLLLAGFLALAIVAAGAPVAGWFVRRRSRRMPKVVADDRAGTVLLLLVLALLAVGGVLHRPAVERERDALLIQAIAARRAVLAQAPPEFRRNVAQLNTTKQAPSLFRSCVPGPTDDRSWCVIVKTDQHPPGVSIDPDQRPNEVVSGPRNPGRR
jgi:hypothetical protein